MTNSIVNNAEKAIVEIALILGTDANTETIKDAILDLLKTKDDLEMTLASQQPGSEGLSLRGDEWCAFSDKVLTHIEEYTVPQYGDKGVDNVTDYSAKDCVLQIRKYATRFDSNQRSNQDQLDCLKMAHYACLTFQKLNAS